MLHIQVQAAPPAAATAQATARRVIGGVRVQYMPSGLAARKLQMSPRTLGKLTGMNKLTGMKEGQCSRPTGLLSEMYMFALRDQNMTL